MDINNIIGLGVAGNFAGHLEQAGEASDFANVVIEEKNQPKAIFPFYIPAKQANFLSIYPLSSDTIYLANDADNLQIEPEIAIICDIEYQNGLVTSLIPHHFAAYNDCSIRRPNAKKISEKKNWGENSKGLSDILIPLDSFTLGSNIDRYRIACFHKRDEILNAYGIDSPAIGYSYFHHKLLEWIINRMNYQLDEGPMNNVSELIRDAHYPKKAIISIGATRYTDFGENNFLQKSDKSIIAVYNGDQYSQQDIVKMAKNEAFKSDISSLIQVVK